MHDAMGQQLLMNNPDIRSRRMGAAPDRRGIWQVDSSNRDTLRWGRHTRPSSLINTLNHSLTCSDRGTNAPVMTCCGDNIE